MVTGKFRRQYGINFVMKYQAVIEKSEKNARGYVFDSPGRPNGMTQWQSHKQFEVCLSRDECQKQCWNYGGRSRPPMQLPAPNR